MTDRTRSLTITYILIILAGALVSSLLGGIFGSLIAWISPEFVKSLFHIRSGTSPLRFAFAVGMIWGLFLGAAVAGFACLLATLPKLFRSRAATSQAIASEGRGPTG